jgi:hypothetical protein
LLPGPTQSLSAGAAFAQIRLTWTETARTVVFMLSASRLFRCLALSLLLVPLAVVARPSAALPAAQAAVGLTARQARAAAATADNGPSACGRAET